MGGDKIVLARRALVLFLRSLPSTCIFNVIGFGCSFQKLYSSSVPYNQSNLDHATKYAEAIDANLGSTALIPPLMAIYGSPQTPGYLTQIFVLTDGHNNEGAPAAVQVIKNNKPFARVFSLGIGSDASVDLVNGIAKEGGGVAEFVLSSTEKIETKVLEQLKIALKPSLLKAVPI
jgi:secreted protein with Ig-like and vWFA domain